MSEEEIKKIAKEEFMNNVMKQLDSALIFTYIQNLENQLQQKENIIKEVRELIEKEYDEYQEFVFGKELKTKLLQILGDENNE